MLLSLSGWMEQDSNDALLGCRSNGYSQAVVCSEGESTAEHRFLPSFWGLLPRVVDYLIGAEWSVDVFTVMKEWYPLGSVEDWLDIWDNHSALPATESGAKIVLLRTRQIERRKKGIGAEKGKNRETGFVYHLVLSVNNFERYKAGVLKDLLVALNCPITRLQNESFESLLAEVCLFGAVPRILVQRNGLLSSAQRVGVENFLHGRKHEMKYQVQNLCYRLTYESHLKKQRRLKFSVEGKVVTVAVNTLMKSACSRRSSVDASRILRITIKQVAKSTVSVVLQAATNVTIQKRKYDLLYETNQKMKEDLVREVSNAAIAVKRLSNLEGNFKNLSTEKNRLQKELSQEAQVLRKEVHELRNTKASLEVANLQLMAMREQFQLESIPSDKEGYVTLAEEYEQLMNLIMEAEAVKVSSPEGSQCTRLYELKADLYRYWRRAKELSHAHTFSKLLKSESELRQEIESLQDSAIKSDRTNSRSLIEQQKIIDQMKEHVSNLEAKNLALNRQLSEASHKFEIEQQTHEIKVLRLESENAELHEHLHVLQSASKKNTPCMKESSDSPSSAMTSATYKKRLAELQSEIMELKTKLQEQHKQNTHRELSIFQRRLSNASEHNENLQQKLDVCVEEMQHIYNMVEAWKSKSSRADDLCAKYKLEVSKLKERLNGVNSSPPTISAKDTGMLILPQGELQSFFSNWRSKLSELSDGVALDHINLGTHLDRLEQVYQSQIIEQQKAAVILRETNEVQDSELRRMHMEIDSLTRKAEAARLQRKAWATTRKALERQMKSLRIENQKLKLTY